MHIMDANGNEILMPINGMREDMDVRRAWSLLGVKFDEDGVI
jgi:hypothetical protein